VKRGRLILATLPVTLFGLAIGFFLWHTIFEYPSHHYDLDFRGANWIGTGENLPNGYFVKEIHIPEEVADAWIAVAATDSVALYVNSRRNGTDTFYSVNVSNLHDVTGDLHKGKNLIAAHIERRNYPGGPGFLLKGVYTDLSGREHVFVSDDTWRVSSVAERQGQGDLLWNERDFDHSRWGTARSEGDASAFPVYHSETPPYLLGKALSGYWICHPTPEVRTAYFMKSFLLKAPVRDALIGVAGIQSYDLNINGMAMEKGALYENKLDIYNITSLLQPGLNTVGIGVKTADTSPLLFVQGYIHDATSEIEFTSDGTWKVIANLTTETHLPDVNSPEWKSSIHFASYPYLPLGVLSKYTKTIETPISIAAIRSLNYYILQIITISIIMLAWLLISLLHSKITKCMLCHSLYIDAILHIPPLVLLIIVYILRYDIRLDLSFPFNITYIIMSIIVLIILRALELLNRVYSAYRVPHSIPMFKTSSNMVFAILILCLMVIGLFIRLHQIDYASLMHDEISMMEYTNGLLERGYPSRINGPYLKSMATYELVPFSISIPVTLFGLNDYGARLHSVFWGTLQILMIYILGKNLFSRPAGLMASAIQTFHPWVINWSQNVFYPQMVQFWATLTVFLLYKAMETDFLKKRFIYATALFFSLAYLTWEGTGFLLLALPLALVAYQAPDFSWTKNKHLWAGFGLVLLVVFVQQSRRILYMDSYLMINGRLAELSLPQLFFLEPMYNPYFYLRNVFFQGSNTILSLVLIVGIFLVFIDRRVRYLYVIIVVPILCMTTLFPIDTCRYVFYVESVIILAASCVIFRYYNSISIAINTDTNVSRISLNISLIAVCIMVLCATNYYVCKLYLLSYNSTEFNYQWRQNIYQTDYKMTSYYIERNFQPGDVIITVLSYPLEYYTETKTKISGDYSLAPLLRLTMFFDVSNSGYPGLIDKFAGLPIIKNLDELMNITGKHDRIWYMSVPDSVLDSDEKTSSYIKQHFKVVYESYNAKVYLWQK
jgi:hypothetical protein